ncbi:hypothetical protein AVEN_209899-1 [Araneus ventricosus]|uniref:Uncharacterized protein n=2 Tax=Araneus ventricosus TaxID=182803 RepID=A0A4Y2CNA7_ARAVE|nr:hypothetical protein AVEN_267852-1 [Araneus ventricosus]GBM05912.1 hypothetical protein AVEN_209899-1 [Araneus ventricosus]
MTPDPAPPFPKLAYHTTGECLTHKEFNVHQVPKHRGSLVELSVKLVTLRSHSQDCHQVTVAPEYIKGNSQESFNPSINVKVTYKLSYFHHFCI